MTTNDWLDIPYPPSAHPGGQPVCTYGDLARWLGGDGTSWTGDFLRLLSKSDPAHREALRRAAPRAVAAWAIWYGTVKPPTGDELAVLMGEKPAEDGADDGLAF